MPLTTVSSLRIIKNGMASVITCERGVGQPLLIKKHTLDKTESSIVSSCISLSFLSETGRQSLLR